MYRKKKLNRQISTNFHVIPVSRAQLALKRHRLVARHHPTRVKDIEDGHGKNHHGAVKGDEVPFRSDQISVPAFGELDGSVDTSDVDADDGKYHGTEQGVDVAGGLAEELVLDAATDKVGGAGDKDGDGKQLENDTGNHDVRARCGVAVDLVGLGGGNTTANGLDDKGDDIAGAKDP